MNKSLPTILTLSLLFIAGCTPKNEFQAPPPPGVTVQNPEQRDVTTYRASAGRVEATDSVELYARVKGFLRSIEFEDGQRVKKGQLLFTIESEQYESLMNSAKAQLEQTKASATLAKTSYERKKKAYETKAVSELDLLGAEAEMQSADAAVLAARAALDNAELDLSYTKVMAPMSGRMSRRYISVGNLVGTVGATKLAKLVVEAPVDVYFNVDERSVLPSLAKGLLATKPGSKIPDVKLEMADGTVHDKPGSVDYVAPEFDPATGTLLVRATFANENIKLLPGLYAKVLIPEDVKDAILIPDLAIQRDLTGTYVLTVNADNMVEPKHIEIGVRIDTMRIVTKGLTPEDRVVVKGIQRARPGIKVNIDPVK